MSLDIQLENLNRKSEALSKRQSLLKLQEKRILANKLIEIGRLAHKVNFEIVKMEEDVLIGAFIEISENLKNNTKIDEWKSKASNFTKSKEIIEHRLTIKFNRAIKNEEKENLKKLNFKWNKFRKEYYGYGYKNDLESLFGTECRIELID